MENRAILSALAASSALMSCQVQGVQDVQLSQTRTALHCDETSGLCFRVDDRGKTCRARSWATRRVRTACPTLVAGRHGQWVLDATATPSRTDEYCRYSWRGAAKPDAQALATLHDLVDSHPLDPDCEVVSVSGGTLAIDETWPALEKAFFEQTERLERLPKGDKPAAPVRVEIIDSSVTRREDDGEPSYGRLEHGRAMGLIVRNLACPQPGVSCRAEVASTLALPLIETNDGLSRDYVNGGYFGSMLDLALAVRDAVANWQKEASEYQLILNLSLGWDAANGGAYVNSPDELDAPARAVWDAIAEARCYGALVIAAAGNRKAGPDQAEGALFPARWARHVAPSAELCASLGVTSLPEGYSTSAPFIVAAGGLESNDADLSLSRKGARPEILAPAAHAVVDDDGKPSLLQTGTSVAAAVTSAAAAVVWSYRPELSADEVMQVVYDGGAALDRPAEVCVGQTPCERNARRVSMCGAFSEACAEGKGGCPEELPACERRPGGRVLRPDVELPVGETIEVPDMVKQSFVAWPCFGALYASTDDEIQNPCPAAQFVARPPLGAVGPQPPKDPICPHCGYDSLSAELYIEIDNGVSGTVTSPVLTVVVDAAQSDVRYFNLSSQVGPMTAGQQTTITNLNIGTTTYESATIEFIVDGLYADVSPVLPL